LEQHASWIIGSMIWLADSLTSDWIMAANNEWMYGCRWAPDEGQLRNPLKANRGVGGDMLGRGRRVVYIQLEDTRDHDDGLRPVPILEHCEPEGFSPVDEEAAAEPLLILHDPMAVAVLPDAEQT
jgi:hypothetical protein